MHDLSLREPRQPGSFAARGRFPGKAGARPGPLGAFPCLWTWSVRPTLRMAAPEGPACDRSPRTSEPRPRAGEPESAWQRARHTRQGVPARAARRRTCDPPRSAAAGVDTCRPHCEHGARIPAEEARAGAWRAAPASRGAVRPRAPCDLCPGVRSRRSAQEGGGCTHAARGSPAGHSPLRPPPSASPCACHSTSSRTDLPGRTLAALVVAAVGRSLRLQRCGATCAPGHPDPVARAFLAYLA